MAELKTQPGNQDVSEFLEGIEDERQRNDSKLLAGLMEDVTGEKPTMWGSTVVGFGRFRYRYASGHEGETFRAGFAPRKAALTVYLGYDAVQFQELLDRLGKHKLGKGCLYIRKLEDVDVAVLEELIRSAITAMENSSVNAHTQK